MILQAGWPFLTEKQRETGNGSGMPIWTNYKWIWVGNIPVTIEHLKKHQKWINMDNMNLIKPSEHRVLVLVRKTKPTKIQKTSTKGPWLTMGFFTLQKFSESKIQRDKNYGKLIFQLGTFGWTLIPGPLNVNGGWSIYLQNLGSLESKWSKIHQPHWVSGN